jgi:hypothetical protein
VQDSAVISGLFQRTEKVVAFGGLLIGFDGPLATAGMSGIGARSSCSLSSIGVSAGAILRELLNHKTEKTGSRLPNVPSAPQVAASRSSVSFGSWF